MMLLWVAVRLFEPGGDSELPKSDVADNTCIHLFGRHAHNRQTYGSVPIKATILDKLRQDMLDKILKRS